MYVLKSALDVGAHLNWIYDRSYIDTVQCRTNSQVDNSYRARLVLDTVSEDNFKVLSRRLATRNILIRPLKFVTPGLFNWAKSSAMPHHARMSNLHQYFTYYSLPLTVIASLIFLPHKTPSNIVSNGQHQQLKLASTALIHTHPNHVI